MISSQIGRRRWRIYRVRKLVLPFKRRSEEECGTYLVCGDWFLLLSGRISGYRTPRGFVYLEFMVKHEKVHPLFEGACPAALVK